MIKNMPKDGLKQLTEGRGRIVELAFKEYFDKMEKVKDKFVFRGNLLLVEILEDDVKETKGGIILQAKDDQLYGLNAGKATMAYVHMVGTGYYDEESDELEGLPMGKGSVVMCPQSQLEYFTTFPGIPDIIKNKLALIPETAIKLYYESVEDYMAVKEALDADR
jgi:co-chaperonin GroES (HSP10)